VLHRKLKERDPIMRHVRNRPSKTTTENREKLYPQNVCTGQPSECGRLLWTALKGVLNSNFRPFSFELRKN